MVRSLHELVIHWSSKCMDFIAVIQMNKVQLILLFYQLTVITTSIKVINNGLAPPEIVHSPIRTKPQCIVKAEPLDLVFMLDSSGSLKNKFQDEIDIIRRIVNHVTIGEPATRVMLIQFSGVQHLEFNFKKFKDREDILGALDVLRHVSGITRMGDAFEYTLSMLNEENGMRPSDIPKIIYLLSDGRTHDYPKDTEMADLLRQQIDNVDIYAYGTGEYVAMNELLAITKDPKKIVTNQNLDDLEPMFDRWRGTEVCEKLPVCVRGSDKPLDLILIIDSSESVAHLFDEQIRFAVERIVRNINVHPDAVRLALITYSGQAYIHFKFNDPQIGNNTTVIRHLNGLKSIKGTTSTHIALHQAYKLLTDTDNENGVREGVKKMIIIFTDGHSQRSPQDMALRLKDKGVEIFAITLTPAPYADESELLSITQNTDHIFTPDFEVKFLPYIGFGCIGLDLGLDPEPRIRGATDITCDGGSLTFTVRTQRPMTGLMYAQQYHDDMRCVTDGSSREISITFYEGTCGLIKIPATRHVGYVFNITVILQFHPVIMTRADQGLSISCFHQQPLPPQEIGRSSIKKLSDTECTYRLHRFAPDQCVSLDAKVGESLFHRWQCDSPSNYHYLIHDCFVKSETKNVLIVDSNGCEVDPHFLETPDYTKFSKNWKNDAYVFKEMSVFKFPGDGNVVFQCQISLCDMESDDACKAMIPPRCSHNSTLRLKRETQAKIKPGFAITFNVETRTLNVLENESTRPATLIKYCDVRMTSAGHDTEQSRTIGTEDAADSKGRVLPRQMIRIQRTEPEENVVRTELRFVIYQSRRDLEEKALFEKNIINEAIQCLMKKYAEMNFGQVLPPSVPKVDANKFAKTLPKEDPSKSLSSKYITDKEWIGEAQKRLELVAKRLQTIEKSATLIAPEFAAFQTQLASLLTDLEERKKAGGSPDAAFYNDQVIHQKLEQLQQLAATTARVSSQENFSKSYWEI
uniref:von Willebrand factor type A domain-containing protein n=1 Tax=Wuchereria bancrofti TaxID=6293 RepID=A0A1I8EH82_WUCBA